VLLIKVGASREMQQIVRVEGPELGAHSRDVGYVTLNPAIGVCGIAGLTDVDAQYLVAQIAPMPHRVGSNES
jgi:hypothetical protein